MIDFVKLNISYLDSEKLKNNSNLQFIEHTNISTGEVYKRYDGSNENIKFRINEKSIRMQGSLHVFYNRVTRQGHQNWDDYNYIKLLETITHLESKFGLDASKTKIENLEYGVNVKVPISPNTLIDSHIILWNDNKNDTVKSFDGKGKFKQWKTSQTFIKIYYKGKQYNLDTWLLRIEMKVVKSAYLKKFGIQFLEDLKDKSKLELLKQDLINGFDKFMILDDITKIDFKDPIERQIFIKAVNPIHWHLFPDRMAKKRFKDKFFSILKRHNLTTLKKSIKATIVLKWDQLMCYDFPDYQKRQTKNKNVTIFPESIQSKCNIYLLDQKTNTNQLTDKL